MRGKVYDITFSDGTMERWFADDKNNLDKRLKAFCKNCNISVTSIKKII